VAAEIRPEVEGGPALAAALAALVGMLAFSGAFVAAELNPGFKAAMQALGSWMPRAQEIGPLSGKFTFMLLAWLGSWFPAHRILRRRKVDLHTGFYLLLVGALVSLLALWPPVIVGRFHG
jgi:hypothetical protein